MASCFRNEVWQAEWHTQEVAEKILRGLQGETRCIIRLLLYHRQEQITRNLSHFTLDITTRRTKLEGSCSIDCHCSFTDTYIHSPVKVSRTERSRDVRIRPLAASVMIQFLGAFYSGQFRLGLPLFPLTPILLRPIRRRPGLKLRSPLPLGPRRVWPILSLSTLFDKIELGRRGPQNVEKNCFFGVQYVECDTGGWERVGDKQVGSGGVEALSLSPLRQGWEPAGWRGLKGAEVLEAQNFAFFPPPASIFVFSSLRQRKRAKVSGRREKERHLE